MQKEEIPSAIAQDVRRMNINETRKEGRNECEPKSQLDHSLLFVTFLPETKPTGLVEPLKSEEWR